MSIYAGLARTIYNVSIVYGHDAVLGQEKRMRRFYIYMERCFSRSNSKKVFCVRFVPYDHASAFVCCSQHRATQTRYGTIYSVYVCAIKNTYNAILWNNNIWKRTHADA